MNRTRSTLAAFALVCAAISLSKPPAFAGDADSLVPEDTCILELELPPGATASVDGRDYGEKRRLEFKPLKRGQIYASKLAIRFREGGQAWRQLLLKGGWRVPLALAAPGGERPELLIQTGHSAQIQSLAFSPDGQYLLSGAGDKCAILWRAADGRQLRRFSAQTMLYDIAFYPRGEEILLIGSRPSESQWPSAVLWDESTGQRTRAFGESRGSRAAFSSDGAQFLFVSQKDAVAICDAGTGRRLRTYPASRASFHSPLAFSPDRQQFLIGHLDGKISLWDVDTGQRLRVFEGGHPRPKTDSTSGLASIARQFEEAANESVGMPRGSVWIRSVAFSADGRRILTTGGESAVVWDAATGQLLHTFSNHAGGNASAVFSPDSSTVLVASSDESGKAALWDVQSGRLVRSFAEAEGDVVAFSPNGRYVACSSGRRESFGVWEVATGQRVRWFEGERITPLHVCSAEGGRKLAAVCGDTAAVWDLPSGRLVRSFKTGVNQSEKIAITPDGRRLFCYNWTGLQLWDVASGVLLRDLQKSIPEGFYVYSIAMSDDGSRAILAGSNREDRNDQLSLWNLENGAKLKDFPERYGKLEMNGLSPDGRIAAVSSTDFSRFLFLDVARGQTLWSVRPMVFMSFSPDGQKVLMSTWTPQTTVVTGIWDAVRGKLLRAMAFEDPDENAWCGAFSPDSTQVLIGYPSGAVRLFDASTGKLLRTFEGHTSFVNALAFGAGGRYVVSGSSDSTLRCWSVATGEELLRLTMVDDGRDWLAATPEGLFDGSEGGRERVAFRVGRGLNVVPVDRFFQDFYRPGLMASLWNAVPTLPDVQIGKSLPPRLKIVTPTAGEVESASVTLEVEATDQGGGISALTLYQNGARVLAPGEKRLDGKILHRSFRVALVEGENRLRVASATADGSWESEPAEIVLRYEKPLAKSRLYVVTVGISRYADAAMSLSFAAPDAQDLAELFQRRGQTLYEQVHLTTLIDDQATKSGIQQALKQAADQTRPQDTLMLFLAGHGTMIGQRYYFIPQDFRKQAERLEDDIRQQGLPADELSDCLGAAAALKRILILDTCASGGALRVALKSRAGFELRGAIERLSRTQGIFTIAASAASEQAQEVKELGHGVLSYALLAGLSAVRAGPLIDKHAQPSGADQVVDVMDWFSFASGQVPRLTETYYGVSQEVQTSTQGASFPLLPLSE